VSDFNTKTIDEFRANQGRVSGPFDGAPMVLVHHVGRRTGKARVNPMMYLAGDDGVLYVFASAGGARTNPDWYLNLVAAGSAVVEVGSETYSVDVTEETGPDRDRDLCRTGKSPPGLR
jgi:deazaflavin-dependent oxidoreductase (nitroreductase family)